MMNQFYNAFPKNGANRIGRLMSVKNSFFALVIMLLTSLSMTVMAQGTTITGVVKDAKGEGLPGVTIQVKGSNKGAQTDMEGKYSISGVSKGATLIFSSVGMETKQMVVGNAGTVDMTLFDDTKTLEQVVVVGYGTQKVKDATGSVASIGTKDFNKGVIQSPEQLLQGRVAGVQMTPASGEPGAGVNINIRGAGSIRAGNGPLFVVDGVPLTGDDNGGGQDVGNGGSSARNPLTFLNPSDIENISILKDASASAIYGSRGANGVILITTKKGKGGQGLQFGASVSMASTAKRYDLLSAADFLTGVKKFGGEVTGVVDGKSNTNWQDQIFRTGITQNYNLGYGGGNEDTRYRVTMGYTDQQGIVKNSGLSRLTGRLNLSQDLFKDKVVVDLSLMGSTVKNQFAPISDNAGFQGSLIGAAIIANPTYPVYNADGSYAVVDNTYHNPVQMLNYISDNDKVGRILGNLSATWKITSNLSYKATFGLDRSTSTRKQWYDPRLNGYTGNATIRGINIDQVTGNGMGIIYDRKLGSTLVEHTLTYDKKIGNNALNALLGYSYQSFFNNNYNKFGYGSGSVFAENLDGFKKRLSIGDSTKSELQSFFGRVNYGIADKYLFTGTLRVDGSSKFGENNKYGYFPAAAFKWKLASENFIPKTVFDDLSLRVNWGQTGNQEFPGGISKAVWQHNYNGSDVPINAANPNIKWETTTTYGAGIDFAVLKGRLSGNIDYFNKNTKDVLFLSVYAQPAAIKQRWVNLPGNIRNTGVEIGLNFQAVQGKNFTWEILANATSLKNKVENFGSTNVYTGNINGQGLSGAYAEIITNNQPLFSFYMPTFTGFDATGISQYANGGTSSIVGGSIPTFTYGLTNNFTYGKWNASVFLNGAKGFYLYNNTANALFLAGSLKTAHNVDYTTLNSSENSLNSGSVSTRFLEKGDFLRLSNATLGYTFDMAKSSAIKSLRVSLTGQNLFLITNYSGLDPEVNTNKSKDDVPSRGIDYTAYPSARTFTIGLNAGF